MDESSGLEDVLPSFEMHNHMFNRSIQDLSLPPNQPPEYLENTLARMQTLGETPAILDPENMLLNNLGTLKKLSVPVNIQLVITSQPPEFNKLNERANPLKQFKPGETVNGYILIENKSKVPIPFEMFLVSLEGEETVTGMNNNSKPVNHFLKSYDLTACYHDGIISAGSARNITEALQKDPIDGSYFGFTQDRFILPNMKHKKFFSFTIPKLLLDTTCPHQLPHHLDTPPSFGCDTRACDGKASQIEINPLLGYGRLDSYGSPLKTNDMSASGQSISFYLHVQIIGQNSNNKFKDFLSATHSNISIDEVFIVKDSKYFIRVDTSLEKPIYQEVNYNQFPSKSTKEQLQYIEHLVEDELHSLIERKNLSNIGIIDRYQQDIIINRNISSTKKNGSSSNSNLNTPSEENKGFLLPVTSNGSLTFNEELDHLYHHESITKFTKDFFNKIDGDLKVSITMEDDCQMYSITPKPLANISQRNLKSSSSSSLSNHPSTTSLTALASSNSLKSTTSIKQNSIGEFNISLQFIPKKQSSMNSHVSLPTSLYITPNLVVYTIQSNMPIPLTFDNKFMYKNFNGKLDHMSRKFHLYRTQLLQMGKETKIGINKPILQMSESLSNLSYSTKVIKNFFKKEHVSIQWVQNPMNGDYHCELRTKILLDDKSSHKQENQLLGLVPSFQSCHLTRGYLIELEITTKRGSKHKDIIHLPLIID